MSLFKKARELPQPKREIIFWTILVIIAIFAVSFWLLRARKRLRGLSREAFFDRIKVPETEKVESSFRNLKEVLEELKTTGKEIEDNLEGEEKLFE